MPDRGEKDVTVKEAKGHRDTLKMHVEDVQKPLMSVSRVGDAGHQVLFSSHGGYSQHEEAGQTTALYRDSNVYRMQVEALEPGGRVS